VASVEERLERLEKRIDQIAQTLEKLEPLLERLEELERTGVLDMLLKTVERLADSFDLLADPKNVRLLATLLSASEMLAAADPQVVTILTDSMGACLKNLEKPETLEMLSKPPRIGGLTGAMRILGDPDVKKLLGLLYVYAKLLGSCLPDNLAKKASELKELYEARLKQLKR
jgi:uncharacterized protein YjgD (DUF1641 family)